MATVSRRDFLQLKSESQKRVAELSCERLYMRYLDSRLSGGDAGEGASEGESERARVFSAASTRELFDGLSRDLEGADVVRLVDPSWLNQQDLRAELEPVLAMFRASGGIVV
jgi:hypothetical protein